MDGSDQKSLIPAKSEKRYQKQYELFHKWNKSKNVTENVVLAYFLERAKDLNPASLWSDFSMLKTTFKVKHNIDFGKFRRVLAYLKQNSKNHIPKKSKILSREECITFLQDAPDENFLMLKVALIMGIYGACRRAELVSMTLDHINEYNNTLIVIVPETQTNRPRTFTITDTLIKGVHPIGIIKKYIALRPGHTPHKRLFIKYYKGECTIQVVGKNTMNKIASKIATFLKLPNPHLYTGHCFRRTSATLLTNARIDMISQKRRGGWKTSTMAEEYVDQPLQNKVDTANNILADQNETIDYEVEVEDEVETTSTSSTHPHFPEMNNAVLINNDSSTSVQLPENSGITIHNTAQGTIIINQNKTINCKVEVDESETASTSTITHPCFPETNNDVLINNNSGTSAQLLKNSGITVHNAAQGTIIINYYNK